MSEKKSICLVHEDIDGAASYCVLCWYKDKRIPVKALSQSDFIAFWKNSILRNIELFEKIYVFDLNVGDHFELFDFSNVTIVDHHQESIANKSQYKRAKVFCENSKSTATLLYKSLKQYKNEEFLTPERKLLLLAASDYDSYTFDLPFSKDLNYLFWSYHGDRVAKFYEEFNTGYKGFNDFQKNIISFYKKRLKETINSLQVYYGEYDGYGNIGGVCLSSEWDSVKLVLLSDYKGETYEQLGKSHNELAQGFFMDDAFLRYALNKWTFKTIGEYKRAFIKYANW